MTPADPHVASAGGAGYHQSPLIAKFSRCLAMEGPPRMSRRILSAFGCWTAMLAATISMLASAQFAFAADPAWKEVAVPDDWKKAPTGENGWLWYRTKLAIPAAWRGRELAIVIEAADDAREVYCGGQFVGRRRGFPPGSRRAR